MSVNHTSSTRAAWKLRWTRSSCTAGPGVFPEPLRPFFVVVDHTRWAMQSRHTRRSFAGWPARSSSSAMNRSRQRRFRPASNMTMIMVMSDVTLPLSEIKKRLSEVVDGVEEHHDRVVLTRNGRPAAVILSPDDLESLEESLEILSNPKAMREIRKAEGEIDRGRSMTAEQLRAKYLAK